MNNLTPKTKNLELGLVPKIVGDNKHYSPANNEWKNSSYAYNKNKNRSTSILDKMAARIIKSYFNLSNSQKLARSKRMRNLLRRISNKKIFVTKPEIKQTADKVNITVYTYDREKQFYIRKLHFYNKNLKLYNLFLNKTLKGVNIGKISQRANKTYLKNIYLRKLISNPLHLKGLTTSRNKLNKTKIHSIERYLSSPNNTYNKIITRNNRLIYLAKRHLIIKNANTKLIKNNLENNFYMFFGKKFRMKKPRLTLSRIIWKRSLLAKKSRKSFSNRRFNRNNGLNIKTFAYNKIRIPYFNLKLKNEMRFFFFKLAYVKKFDYLRKLFFLSFIKYVLSIFHVKVKIKRIKKSNNLFKLEFTIKNNKTKQLSSKYYKTVKVYSNNKLKLIQTINMELLQFLDLTLYNNITNNLEKDNGIVYKEKIYSLYNNFKAKYFLLFLRKSLKKEILALSYYTKFAINHHKFGKFLPGLKLIISKIYSKKVELNLVNLKYSHLNSDIYTQSIANKLRRKKVSLLRVLRRALSLVKTPYEFFAVNNTNNINNLPSLTMFKSLSLKNGELVNTGLLNNGTLNTNISDTASYDKMNVILNKLYPNSLTSSFSLKSFETTANKNAKADTKKSSIIVHNDTLKKRIEMKTAKNVEILNQIRYKWVTGVRLEAAGRLTRRYTASRSVFKLRYKGNLRNLDYSLKTNKERIKKSNIMLRNYIQPNLQYSFTKSKRRIGAFGIKGWINSY